MLQILKKFTVIILMATTVFAVSGLGVLAHPKPAKAAAWLTVDIDEQLNRVLVAIWKFAIFPILKKLVVKFASGDLSINGLDVINQLANSGFQALQAVMLTYTGFSLCSDIKGNLRTAFARAGTPGDYIPSCTLDRSKLAKTIITIGQAGVNGGDVGKAILDAEKKFISQFAVSLQGSNNDFGTWFGLRSNHAQQYAKQQQNYRFEVLVNQGFFGARDCGKLNVPGSTKAETEASPRVKKTAKKAKKGAEAATIDKYKDCRIKSPGLMFAEDAKKSIEGLKQGSIQATAIQDIIALSGLFIDTLIETSLTGFWNAVTNTGTTSQQSSESQGSDFQRTGENRQVEWPQAVN